MRLNKTLLQVPAFAAKDFRLRSFVQGLSEIDELDVHAGLTNLTEIAATLESNPKAVLFEQVGSERCALVGNVLSSRNRLARAFGVSSRELLGEVLRRLANRPEIVQVPRSEAPVQEMVTTGDGVDLTKLPIHLQHGLDGAPYISAAMDFAIDKATGWTNVGIRRLMLRSRREAGIDLLAPSDLRAMFLASVSRSEPLPLSIVVGGHPIDYLAATMRIPVDELGLISSLRGTPLSVVKSVSNDIYVPADAEWVLEGYLDAKGFVEPEGPYGEFLGYYGGVKINPIFHVTAITHRHDALFQTLTIGGHSLSHTDTAQLAALRTEALIWRSLENAVRDVVSVYALPSSGGVYNVRIAMRQKVPGEVRNAIAAAFSSQANIKNVFVVDPDIDIFSHEQMDWALGTRFQPHRDIVIESGFRTLPLDPSLDGVRLGSKAGFDLTMPVGSSGLETMVPSPPRFEGRRFDSVLSALSDGPKSFEQLMTAVGSDDGREVLLVLEELRERGQVTREGKNGFYRLNRPE